MPVQHIFKYTDKDGNPAVDFTTWVNTVLPEDERPAAFAAIARHHIICEEYIANGSLVLIDGGYEWKDDEAFAVGKPDDEVWLTFWDRYAQYAVDNGIVVDNEIIRT